MHLCFFEDDAAERFLPLTFFRPVYDLRCGAFTLRERAVRLLRPRRVSLMARAALVPLLAEENPAAGVLPAGDLLFLNGRVIMTGKLAAALRKAGKDTILLNGSTIVAARISGAGTALRDGHASPADILASAAGRCRTLSVDARVIERPWDLLTVNESIFDDDAPPAGRGGIAAAARVHRAAVRVRPARIRIGAGSTVEALAVLDAEHGPIIIGRNVTIMSGAVIRGPVAIGDGSMVKARAVIYGPASIGPGCKIGGEADSVILQANANKQHDGFLGHSYLGAWVNLGAGTTTSNLKNTYGTIRVASGDDRIDTGRMFLGVIAGDHVKTGINTPLDTGTIIGPSSSVFGGVMPPKDVPAFSWGEGRRLAEYDPERALAVAVRVMARRKVVATDAYSALFRQVYSRTSNDRQRAHR